VASFIPGVVGVDSIEAILKEAKIEFMTEGSRAYQILVMPKDVKKAIDALKRSKMANKITFYPAE
jgi:hypothetical protein